MTGQMRTLAVILLAACAPAWAQPGQPGGQLLTGEFDTQWDKPGNAHVRVEAVPSLTHAPPGGEFHVAVRLTIDEGWMFYSPDPGAGKAFRPTAGSVAVESDVLEIGEARWLPDVPHAADIGDGETVINNVYVRETVVYIPATVPAGAAAGEASLSVPVNGQLCSETSFECLRVAETAGAAVQVADTAVANPAWMGPLAAGLADALSEGRLLALHLLQQPIAAFTGAPLSPGAADWAIWTGLSLAVLAGLILNVMPCVLPVIPIRIMSIVEAGQGSRRRFVTLGLAFAGGIVLFFVGLGVVNIVLRLATQELFNWGRHFQFRSFRIGMAMLMVALACNLFGLFNVVVPRRIAAMDSGASARAGGHLGAVGMGLMMAILATPCSFALLMGVLGWASLQAIWVGTLAFLLMGAGMAAPHALLAAFPSLASKLPRPGRWMELLKHGMGFAVLAVAAWLIGTLSENSQVMRVMGFGVLLAMALWVWGAWVRYDAPLGRKLAVRGAAVAAVVLAGVWLLPTPKPLAVNFEPFSEARIVEARRDGHVVLVKFSASWCGSCMIIDRTIYNDPSVARELLDRSVVAMKGDVSNKGAAAEGLLYDHFHSAPPLTVVYPPGDGPAIRLEGEFSHAALTAALDAAGSQQ